jgi:glycosyltransferase involved in cell wall biosynthesis
MYDAINKGWCNALGDILCYLNCDEQYLPGMLEYVERYFVEHPEVDMIFGDVIVVNPEGQFLSYRKGYPVRWFYIPISLLYVYTCTMFFRRRIFDDGYFFDTSYKSVADADFVMRVQRAGYTIRHVKRYFSTFTFSGSNLSEQPVSVQEKRRLYARAPRWVKLLRHPLNAMRLVEKMIAGAYRQTSPLTYAIYEGQGERRKEFTVLNPGWRWPGDMQGQEAHVLKGAR